MHFPRILVGCPTCDLKADSLDEFLRGISKLSYPNFDVIIEDNSSSPSYANRLKDYAADWEKKHPGRSFRVVHSGYISEYARDRVVNGRNIIRSIVLNENYDYFFSLEQDVVPPNNIIEELLESKKDVVSGVYFTKKFTPMDKKYVFMAGIAAETTNPVSEKNLILQPIGIDFLFPTRVAEVMYCGLGCVLISRRVLEKITFRYEKLHKAWDDIFFLYGLT